MDYLDQSLINQHLSELNVKVFDIINSTNVYAKEQIKSGHTENSLIIADCQTAGHGRFDRKFYSEKSCGIYLSFALKLKSVCEDTAFITTAVAVAVTRALERLTNKTFKIKWVNDIYLNNKKVCGILVENLLNIDGENYTVVGIGINVFKPQNDFDNSIKSIATSIFENEKPTVTRNEIIIEIAKEFLKVFNNLDDKSFIEEYKSKLLGKNKPIFVLENGALAPATMLGVDDKLHLIAKFKDGTVKHLSSGEISVKLK